MRPPHAPDLDASAQRLLNALTGAVVRCLRRQESICIATSGGLDSSVLAALAARHFDETVQLVTVSTPGGTDSARARLLSRHLGVPLVEIVLHPSRVERLLPDFVPLLGTQKVDPALADEWNVPHETRYVSPVMAAWELPIYLALQEARLHAPRVMVGQGADETLAGYARYLDVPPTELRAALAVDHARLRTEVLPVEARLAERFRIDVRYPYLDPVVQSLCAALPREFLLHEGERKRILRRVAAMLDLPREIAAAPKTAAQYGSGAADLLSGLAEAAGLHQNEYLTGFLDQRRMGEPHSLRT